MEWYMYCTIQVSYYLFILQTSKYIIGTDYTEWHSQVHAMKVNLDKKVDKCNLFQKTDF